MENKTYQIIDMTYIRDTFTHEQYLDVMHAMMSAYPKKLHYDMFLCIASFNKLPDPNEHLGKSYIVDTLLPYSRNQLYEMFGDNLHSIANDFDDPDGESDIPVPGITMVSCRFDSRKFKSNNGGHFVAWANSHCVFMNTH